MPADENGHSTREACGHPFVTDDCVMCEVDTMKRETANLQRQIKELRTPVEKVTLGGVDMSPNYKGDGVSDGWVPHAELIAARVDRLTRERDEARAALDRQSPFDDQIVFTADAALEQYALGNRRGFTETHEELPDAKTDPVRLGLGDSELPDSPDSP